MEKQKKLENWSGTAFLGQFSKMGCFDGLHYNFSFLTLVVLLWGKRGVVIEKSHPCKSYAIFYN